MIVGKLFTGLMVISSSLGFDRWTWNTLTNLTPVLIDRGVDDSTRFGLNADVDVSRGRLR